MNILLTSHGSLCCGLNDAFHMFASTATHVHHVSLTDSGIDDFRERLTAKLSELLAAGDVLIMADLQGGTPYNESFALLLNNPGHVRLVAGANLPMLIEVGVLTMSSDNLQQAYEAALAAGAAGVVGAEPPAADADDGDDDLF